MKFKTITNYKAFTKKLIKNEFKHPNFNPDANSTTCMLASCVHVQELNMEMFEEQFKTKAQGAPSDLSTLKVKVAQKAPTKISLMDTNKAKNLAITLRKAGMSPDDVCVAIDTYGPPLLLNI